MSQVPTKPVIQGCFSPTGKKPVSKAGPEPGPPQVPR